MSSHLEPGIDAAAEPADARKTIDARLSPWLSAVVLSGLAFGIRLSIDPVLGHQLPFSFFYVAVALTAYLATPGATALAILLGYAGASLFFVAPPQGLLPTTGAGAAARLAYFAVCGFIAATSHLTGRAKRRAQANAAELARRHEQLRTGLAERDRAEHALRLQSSVATELLKTRRTAEVYDLVADRIHAVAEGAIVSMSEFDPRDRTVTVRTVRGSPDERARAVALLGRDPEGLTLKFDEQIRKRWKPGELERVDGLHELLFRQVPRELCDRIVSELGLGDLYGMACAHEEDILGTVAVITHGRGPLRDRKLIESLVAQAGLALKRIRAEEARQETEQRFRLLFETTSDGIWIHTLDGIIREVNDAYCAMSGYTRAELEGMPIGVLEASESAEEIARHIEKVRGGGHDRFESKHRRKDGSLLDVDVTALLERSRARIAIFARDITQRKRTEEALRQANVRLAEADRRKNEFLAVLSHELRNPLAPIRNSVYVMERVPPGGEQAARALRVIDRQVNHLARLTDDLLDVTRISRGKIRLQREPLELNVVVRATADDLRELFVDRGVRFDTTRIAEEPLHVDADRTRIAQVVGNLLQNAVKFTFAGGHAELALRRDEGEAVIEVRDDGAGLEPELLARLFEPFVQAEKTLDRTGGGLGLGLALVKGLVELHGGTVQATSGGPGKGAAFSVRLPLVAGAERAARTPVPATAPGARRVLVIEDGVDAARSLEEALQLCGHAVDVALTGREGIAKALATAPDVVLCDIGLPDVDGYGVAEALRADARTGSIFLVALSGYASQEDVDRAREAGFDRHVAKPPDLEGLRRLLAEVPARPPRPGAAPVA